MNRKTKKVVYRILEQDEEARKNDNYLIFRTLNEMTGINKETGIWYVLNNMNYKGISFESITRHRRKFLELHPEFKDDKAEKIRREEEENYILEYGTKL